MSRRMNEGQDPLMNSQTVSLDKAGKKLSKREIIFSNEFYGTSDISLKNKQKQKMLQPMVRQIGN